ncbi:MAG: YraN family protein [Acidobacteria bacterium]|nr:YraN family protein [Acidobacteriota bacterium]
MAADDPCAPAPPSGRTARGRAAEAAAEQFLRSRGFAVLDRNARYRRGELDIVARLGDLVVFVEVRCRRARSRFAPEATIDAAKRRRLSAAAARWLGEHGLGNAPCRFDVVAVESGPEGLTLRHHPGAFVDDEAGDAP